MSLNGSDEAGGQSEDQSLRSITEGLKRARAQGGATIRVLPGVYGKETETFPLEPPPNTTITAENVGDPPLIFPGTRNRRTFWVHDIPWERAPEGDGEPPWPGPDEHAPVLAYLKIEGAGDCLQKGGGILVERATPCRW